MNKLDEIIFTTADPDKDSLTRRYLLGRLIEECAEVIQAAEKCLAYGYDRDWPGYGINYKVLEAECINAISIMQVLELGLDLNYPHEVPFNYINKILKIAKWHKYMREHPV